MQEGFSSRSKQAWQGPYVEVLQSQLVSAQPKEYSWSCCNSHVAVAVAVA
jgi:hypothetical protein